MMSITLPPLRPPFGSGWAGVATGALDVTGGFNGVMGGEGITGQPAIDLIAILTLAVGYKAEK